MLNVLAGLFDATSGEVEVNGLSLPDDIDTVQKLMGVCPQHVRGVCSVRVSE